MSARPTRRPLTVAVAAIAMLGACDQLATEAVHDGDVFDAALPGLTADELAAFARGDAEFERRFSPASGLGPIFNNVACASCHSGDGRGRLANALQRIGTVDDDMMRAVGGPQIQDKAIPGAIAERLPAGAVVSLRLPPPVFGVGLIEAIPDAAILANADPDDRDGDGISGRPNWVTPNDYAVPNAAPPGLRLGRFGRKAQTATLLEQTVEAYHQDMGITSDFQPRENHNPLSTVPIEAADIAVDPEVPPATVQAVVHYLRTLAPPRPGTETDLRREGRELFASVGCASCHVPTLQTGPSPIAALSNQPVELYSDLLLHDMGDALADNRPDGGASGREWRTTPLWGLRLMRQFLNGEALLLHDGRARTVEEAILLHGGEAQRARDAFAALNSAQRRALLDFVESR
ncbi:MAG TPA: di-heme oxidoredictase family protein [Gemmatimonadaceae bacterium]|nr:di-heme oxidoredictase family protein [Gemmatimonadaceae bacterium]